MGQVGKSIKKKYSDESRGTHEKTRGVEKEGEKRGEERTRGEEEEAGSGKGDSVGFPPQDLDWDPT
jgi:hypothetical protein